MGVRDDAYIPHQLAGDDERLTPVLIAAPESMPAAATVINLRDARRRRFRRVLEVVPADDAAREPLRARWTQYKARGLQLHKFDM